MSETLVYNALGQMVQTSAGAAGTVLYMYDESGHLLGEYSSTGALIDETVWLGDVPVATLQPSGSSVAVYYIEADHLNTPRQVTRPSDNKQMWTWFSDPFGTTPANSNPAGAGTFTYNLRFPGLIYDAQAGLHQNYYRDYDPAVGRYVESDPIGLAGGVNTYAYADESSMDSADPLGLYPFNLPQILYNLKLPTTGDCNETEKAYCTAKCAPARSLGCYVTIRWKLKGIRGGEPIRSEQRSANCNCEELDACVSAPKKGGKPSWLSPPPFIIPWLVPALP